MIDKLKNGTLDDRYLDANLKNKSELLKNSNLLAKFGKVVTPVSFALLALTAGIFFIVIKILLENI